MRIVVTGASGLLGRQVVDRLRARGDEVTGISRQMRADGSWLAGDVTAPGAWQDAVRAADAVVHLAGEPLDRQRWSAKYKARLESSRIDSTRRVVEALGGRPATLVSASAAGFYGPRGEEPLDEASPPGTTFLARLCQRWEAEAAAASSRGVRVIPLRFGVILSGRGGALVRMVPAFKGFLGGPIGDAQGWFPWIHEDDAAGLVLHALDSPRLAGPVNVVAPELVRMGDFSRALGRVLRRPALVPAPVPVLRLLLGQVAEALNPGQKILPRAALASGYRFRHERLDGALAAALTDRAT
jgi:uncharacterized protein (TIGR01777 family)